MIKSNDPIARPPGAAGESTPTGIATECQLRSEKAITLVPGKNDSVAGAKSPTIKVRNRVRKSKAGGGNTGSAITAGQRRTHGDKAAVPAALKKLTPALNRLGAPMSKVARLVASGHYNGDELVAAVKTLAILHEASQPGRLSAAMQEHLSKAVAAIETGALKFGVQTQGGAYASYNSLRNLMLLPADLDLSSPTVRSFVIHEAIHVAQDADQENVTLFASEKNGHLAAADYLLRNAGVVSSKEEGSRAFDVEKFQALVYEVFANGAGREPTDQWAIGEMAYRFLLQEGVDTGEVNKEDLLTLVRYSDSDGPVAFENLYSQAESTRGGRRRLGERVQRDGVKK